MRYDWKCKSCGARTEVNRPIRMSHVGPYAKCRACNGTSFKKCISTGTQAIMREAHNSPFPLTVKGLDAGVARNPDGSVKMAPTVIHGETKLMPVIEYRDVVFKSRKEQQEWLKANGKCLLDDGKDPSIGASQHSHYDAYDPPPPTEGAKKIFEGLRYVEDPKELGFDVGETIVYEGA